MSSIVNKSNVRFAPKIKQRRVSKALSTSRRASLTPSIEPTIKEDAILEENDDNEDENSENEKDNNKSSDEEQAIPISLVRRRSSTADYRPETKQRRLSTLSNTTRDVLKKATGFENEKPHVIGIPIATPPQTNIRRRSSVARRSSSRKSSVSLKEPSAVINILPTPPSTQIITESQTNQVKTGKRTDLFVPQSPKSLDTQDTQLVAENSSGVKINAKDLDEDQNTQNQGQQKELNINECDRVFKSFKEIPKYYNQISADVVSSHKIDEDSFTMEELCRPVLPIGKASSKYEQAMSARKERMKKRLERRNLRAEAKKNKVPLVSFEEPDKVKREKIKAESLLDDKLEEHPEGTANAIQLKVGQDGNLIVDEESRYRDRHANFDHGALERHEENPFENIVNSSTYGKQSYSDKWDDAEIKKFYEGLSQWGTDFGLIAQTFPHRTRRQIKAKFISEEKRRPNTVELALARKLNFNFDLDKFSVHSNKVYPKLEEFNEKLERLKQDHEQNLKELVIAKEKAKEEDTERQKKIEFEVKTGKRTLTRKERVVELRKHETVLGSIDDIKKQREEEAASALEAEVGTS